MERRRRRLAVLCAHLRPSHLSASPCAGAGAGGGHGGATAPAAAAAAAAEEEEEEEVSGDKGCVFCAIVRGESPAFKVYEDDVCLCILDSNPLSHGHSLIIPKCHFPSLEATPPPRVTNGYYPTWSFHPEFFFLPIVKVVAAMCSKVPFLSNAIMKAAQCAFLTNNFMPTADSFNLLVNNGSAAGQVIFHTHFHIIPRKAGDQLWPSESFRRRPLERNQETIGLVNSIKEHLCASPCSESRTEGSAAPKDL